MRIIHNSNTSFNDNNKLHRLYYNRISAAVVDLIGDRAEDFIDPMIDMLRAFNNIDEGIDEKRGWDKIDIYLGSLGVFEYYGHNDINIEVQYGRK
jgi:hypothetical protein